MKTVMHPISLVLFAALLAGGAGGAAAQQGYPSRPIRFIVPYPPGGSTDILARVIGQNMSARWGQQVVIDNRSGAGGIVGTEIAATAPPDGHTIIMVTSSHATLPSLYKKMPYDTLKDFAPVTLVSSTPYILVAHPKLGVKSVKELISLLKSKPGQFNYASSSSGGMGHIAGELFKSMAAVDMVHVPYKGSGAAIPDVLGGHVPLMFDNILSVLPHVKSGRLIALAVSTARRSPVVPELPTVAESGLPGFDVGIWFGVLAPANTPAKIVTALNSEIVRILQTPDMRERLSSQGAEPIGGTPKQFAEHIKAEMVKWGKVIRDAGIRID